MDLTYNPQDNRKIWINGNFIDAREAKIHVLTHSLHYGGAVYEGIKCYEGKIFKLKDHIIRLFNSAEAMMLKVPFSIDEICTATVEIIAKNNIKNAYIRPLVWRNSKTTKLLSPDVEYNVMIAAFESPQINDESNVNTVVSKWHKQSPKSAPSHAKCASIYAMMLVCIMEAKAAGFDDALLLDDRGYIAEFSTSNIFFVDKKKLVTPKTYSCIEGITRQSIIDFANSLGYVVEVRDILPQEITAFEACFASGTAAGIRSVRSITYNNQITKFPNQDIVEIFKQEYKRLVLL